MGCPVVGLGLPVGLGLFVGLGFTMGLGLSAGLGRSVGLGRSFGACAFGIDPDSSALSARYVAIDYLPDCVYGSSHR